MIAKITIPEFYQESYLYLKKLKMQPAKVLGRLGFQGMYEYAREVGYYSRQADEKAENPFSNNFLISEYKS